MVDIIFYKDGREYRLLVVGNYHHDEHDHHWFDIININLRTTSNNIIEVNKNIFSESELDYIRDACCKKSW